MKALRIISSLSSLSMEFSALGHKLAASSRVSLTKAFLVCRETHPESSLLMLITSLAQFGLFLTPEAIGHAELTLGGVDETKVHGPLTFITQPSSNGNWNLPSSSIAVNGKTTHILTANRTIIFDSGTSSLCFSKQTTEVTHCLRKLRRCR